MQAVSPEDVRQDGGQGAREAAPSFLISKLPDGTEDGELEQQFEGEDHAQVDPWRPPAAPPQPNDADRVQRDGQN
jgi:hypothetical protein